MKAYTIGFTEKSAEQFFNLLKKPDIMRVVDVRLNNVSQLAGFAKKDNLKYFLKELCSIDYIHRADLAPTKEMRDSYNSTHNWDSYKSAFITLLDKRRIKTAFPTELVDGSCFLCAEPGFENCHRSLVVDYFKTKWKRLEIVHL